MKTIYVVVKTIVDQRYSFAAAAFVDQEDAGNFVKLEKELLKDDEWDESTNILYDIDKIQLHD